MLANTPGRDPGTSFALAPAQHGVRALLYDGISSEEEHKARRLAIGHRLRVARAALGLRQADLMERYGVRMSNTSNWETGRSYMDPLIMLKLCEDYGLTMDYFWRGLLSGVRADVANEIRRIGPDYPSYEPRNHVR